MCKCTGSYARGSFVAGLRQPKPCCGHSCAIGGWADSSFVGSVQSVHIFVDFVCIERKLVVEVDGEPHDIAFEYDSIRDAALITAGYHILRFRNDDVRSNLDGVRRTIINALEAEPLPSP